MSMDKLKSIRNLTGLSYKDIQKAIVELPDASEEEIITHLRKQGVLKQQSREGRETSVGMIFSYVHEGKIGVLIEILCETDFVAKSPDFVELGNSLALHIAAFQPKFLSREEVDPKFIEAELDVAKELLLSEGKPADIIDRILEGKKNKLMDEFTLLSQPYIKNQDISVSEYISEVAQKTGEKIVVKRYTIYTLNS
jgi:elongation factor Ts